MVPAETLACSALTAVLVYLSTFELDAIEVVLLVLCFLAIIWILAAPLPVGPKATRELFEDAFGASWHTLDASAYKELAELPVKVKDLIQPPIQEMVHNSTKGDDSSDPNNLENIDQEPYVEAEDTYIGRVETVTESDAFGKESHIRKLVVQEDRFKAMKLEYKKLDAMLAKLREGDKGLYARLIPQVVQEEQP